MLTEDDMTTDHALGLRSLSEEVGPVDLPIAGRLPAWLDGALLRTGPGLFEVGESPYRHWFDGLGMLYRYGFEDGRVRYSNRLLRSKAFEAARSRGRVAYGEFGSVADTGVLGRLRRLVRGLGESHNANVSVITRADGVFALTETPTAMQFDPDTLATIGPRPFGDELNGQITTAHPHTDAERRVQINYLIEFGRRSVIHVFEHPLDGRERRVIGSVPVDHPPYMHSFGMTDRHVVLVDSPYRVSPLRLRFSSKPFIANYRWHRGEPTLFHLVDRADGTVTTVEGDACFMLHQANAFDDGEAVTLDLCAYPDADIVHAFDLEHMRELGTKDVASSGLLRYRLPKSGGAASVEEVFPDAIDMPRINDGAAAARCYRNLWAASKKEPTSAFFDRIVRIDVVNGSCAARWERENCFTGEPVFVPRPGGGREAEGLILSVIVDGASRRSFLVALDAETLEEIARADLPHVVPFHFHGRHVTKAECADTVM